MSLTRDTPQEFPLKLHIGSGNPNCSFTPTKTIDNLPGIALLEIFDLYRLTFGDQFRSARVWNSKTGWFKLAHVCHNWRSVVLASPSRLRMRLYFADSTPTNALALEYLSHLPIVIDYSGVSWNASSQDRLISALRHPDRVRGITIRCPQMLRTLNKIIESLNLPFPALEGLELENITTIGRILLATSLMTSIQSLRHLRLTGASVTSFFPLLSATRAIIDLTLSFDTVLCLENGESLLTHLQHMPHLRNLQVSTRFYRPEETPSTMSVLLAELTSFRFFGECAEIEWLLAGLVTPSLREFYVSAYDRSGTLHIPYLSELIRVAGIAFLSARISISGLGFAIYLIARPHPAEDLPSKRVMITTTFMEHPGGVSSAMLATIEDIFFSPTIGPIPIMHFVLSFANLAPWRQFFEEFRNVKPATDPPPAQEGIDPDAITPFGTSINSNGSQFTFGIFPSLEEIVVYARTSDTWIDEKVRASVLESFGPFMTARHDAGRPELPRYFLTENGA
ncbi:hypothetical protein BJV77DRAFT_1023198 [Russula vinacea]|nr:hypothetical protein BJV77DRAFT_1023198 [Russula vinacea]